METMLKAALTDIGVPGERGGCDGGGRCVDRPALKRVYGSLLRWYRVSFLAAANRDFFQMGEDYGDIRIACATVSSY